MKSSQPPGVFRLRKRTGPSLRLAKVWTVPGGAQAYVPGGASSSSSPSRTDSVPSRTKNESSIFRWKWGGGPAVPGWIVTSAREGAGGRLPGCLEDGGRGPGDEGRALTGPEDGALAGILRPVDVDAVERGVLAARARAEEVGEAGVGGVDVEEAGPPAAVAREGVDVPGRHDHRRPGATEVPLAAERELELALEEEERIRVALVEVGGGARVGRPGVVLDEAELGPRDLDEVDAVLALEPLALAGPADDRLGSVCHLDPRLTLGAPRPTTRFRAYSRDSHPWRADRDESVA